MKHFTLQFFLKSALFISFLIFISKILGLVKQQYIFYLFNDRIIELDAFIGASRIPNSLRELLAEGALSSAFITVFSCLRKENPKKAIQFIYDILNLTFFLNIIFILVAILFSYFIFPFYHNHPLYPEASKIAQYLFQILILYLPILSISSIFMGILNSYHHYNTPYLGPIFFNIIFLIFIYISQEQLGIYSLAFGLLLGSLIQLILQMISFKKLEIEDFKFHFSFKKIIPFKMSKDIKYFLASFVSFSMVMAIPKLGHILSNVYSDSIRGANTALSQAFFLFQIPLSIFLTGISTISLSRLSEIKTQKNIEWIEIFLFGSSITLRFMFPFCIIMIILSKEISQFFYQDLIQIFSKKPISIEYQEIILNIAKCLVFFSPSLISSSLNILIIRILQSHGNRKYLIQASVISFIFTFIFIEFFMHILKISFHSIALSITLSSFIQLGFLFQILFFKKDFHKEWIYQFIKRIYKPIVSTIFMGIILYIINTHLKSILLYFLSSNIIYTPNLVFFSILIYIFGLVVFSDKELFYFFSLLKRKKG